jgi:hypothetical protein
MGRIAGVSSSGSFRPRSSASLNLTGKHSKGFMAKAPPVGKRASFRVRGKITRHSLGEDFHDVGLNIDSIEHDDDDAATLTEAMQKRTRNMRGSFV